MTFQNTIHRMPLLSDQEAELRTARVRKIMAEQALDAILISTNANKYYMSGRVFCGFIFIPLTGRTSYAVRRPNDLQGPDTIYIRKIEDLPAMLGYKPGRLGLEMSSTSYSGIMRIKKAFGAAVEFVDASPALALARSVKTPQELEKIRQSAIKQTALYERIPHLYQAGMRDIDLQIEIERVARMEGCLGQFRVNGDDMELFMGSVLAGENADTPSPYDFAMGGAGMDPSLPVGADGTLIRAGESVMVDVNGNFTGYMSDMTRCLALRECLPQKALDAHSLSIDICDRLAEAGQAGTEAAELYRIAETMTREAGFEDHFMGHRQHAAFAGHGLGIEINELPVIAPRSKSVLEAGNVIALEPKFVIPGTGAVGIENTYIVKESGAMECITTAPSQIIYFE